MKKTRQRGQNLIEFALVLPVLLIILIILADLSRAIAANIALVNAAREGARYAVLHPTDINGIRNRALLEYNNSGTPFTAMELRAQDIIITFPQGSSESGNSVRVTAQSQFPVFFGSFFPAGIIDANGTMTLHGDSEMIIF